MNLSAIFNSVNKTNLMTKQFLTFLLFACTLLSCEKNNLNYSVDSEYPTVAKKLNSATLSELRTSFAQKNKYLSSSLNDYGFCSLTDIQVSADTPPILSAPTQPEAIETVKSFVSLNPACTGVENASDLTFTQIFSSTPYWDGASSMVLKSANQRIDTIEVINSQIIFQLKSRELVYCMGNWFPKVYIPNKFNIDREDAKSSLLNKVVWHSTIAGVPYSATITAASLAASTTRLVVFPYSKTADNIELRVTWQINIPGPVYYLIFVDVMTGEIIGEQPTIIS
ncbi:MAG TPA: hypothetical protein VGK38_14975 [Prolixibacteraceae bacterium]|jgi:hypothetical protein